MTSDTDAGNPIRKAPDHESIWICLDLFQTPTHWGFILNNCVVLVVSRWGRDEKFRKGLVVEHYHQKTSHVPCIFPNHIQILLIKFFRFHPSLTEPSQVVSMMEKMVWDLVGEQFAKHQSNSSFSMGLQVAWQIHSKVVGETQSSTRSIYFFKQIHLFCDSWAISMTQWDWISGILLTLISNQGQEDWGGRQSRRRSLWEVWVQSLVMDLVTWTGSETIACREHWWWKVSDLELVKFKLKQNILWLLMIKLDFYLFICEHREQTYHRSMCAERASVSVKIRRSWQSC